MKYTFKSKFSDNIEAYIKLRCSLGYQEDSYARRLHMFDQFCCQHYPNDQFITQEISEHWSTLKPNEKTRTLQLRTGVLRGFAKYLVSTGVEAYILPYRFLGKCDPFRPYLYTTNELRAFFKAADTLPAHKLSLFREIVIPVIFRMLYCCGLRPQEVRHLKKSDVNLIEGTIYITNSKRNKDRIVPMSDDLLRLCNHYNMLIDVRIPNRTYFFQNPNGGFYSAAWIQQQFLKCWKHASITFEKEHHPRVYDWRHNFVTQRILQWAREGKDVKTLLPYLSTYLGHDSLKYTFHYIHLVPEHLPKDLSKWAIQVGVPIYED